MAFRGMVGMVVLVVALATCSGDREAAPEPPVIEPATRAEPAPIRVTVQHIEIIGMDNAAILGRGPHPTDDAAAAAAVEGARAALERYLNAQFIAAGTRFSGAPLEEFLAPTALAALTREARTALGTVRLRIDETAGGPAPADAQVLLDGETIYSVTLSFASRVFVRTADGVPPVALEQRGTAVLRPWPEGWRVEAFDGVLDTRQVPSRPLPPEAPGEAVREIEMAP